MTQVIRHRGPDDEGFAFFGASSQVYGGKDTPPHVYEATLSYTPKTTFHDVCPPTLHAALGHRRLSILDLSAAGHQPMCTADQRYWITYNGEIYNYLEIRQELTAKGHRFATHTDTEVILTAFQEWGTKAFSHFNGMFAFVLYDAKLHRLYAVRDRFGVKPLYYWVAPQGFLALASEIKQFTVLPGWDPVLHGQCAYDFLNWGIKDHTSDTFFAGVKQLPGGHFLELSAEDAIKPIPKPWYRLTPTPFQGSMDQAASGFRDLLEDAVRLRLRADVDVGSCLSGGLDSSSIVCLANGLLRQTHAAHRQKTFTACSEVKRFDEKDHADIVVSHTGVDARYTYPSLNNLFDVCSDLVWYQDEPFVTTSMYAQWSVFELVKQHGVKVVLDGQGSDEQLAGYHGFFGNRLYDLLITGRIATLVQEIQSSKKMHSSLEPLALLLNKLTPDLLRQPIRQMLGKSSKHSGWFNIGKLGALERDPLWGEPHKTVLQQSIQQLQRSSLPMLLHYEDRNSMAHSVESRTPFLDYRLVEYTLGLPSDYKIAQGWTKRVLREGMKGILPEEIRCRVDKLGFVTAEEIWMRQDAPDRFRKAIREAVDLSDGIIRPTVLVTMEEILQGKRPFNFLLWRIISFGEWIKRFHVCVNS